MAEHFWQDDFSVKFPCKDCPDRHPACWSECERYKQAKKDHAEKTNQIEKQKQLEKDVLELRVKRASRAAKIRAKKQW